MYGAVLPSYRRKKEKKEDVEIIDYGADPEAADRLLGVTRS